MLKYKDKDLIYRYGESPISARNVIVLAQLTCKKHSARRVEQVWEISLNRHQRKRKTFNLKSSFLEVSELKLKVRPLTNLQNRFLRSKTTALPRIMRTFRTTMAQPQTPELFLKPPATHNNRITVSLPSR